MRIRGPRPRKEERVIRVFLVLPRKLPIKEDSEEYEWRWLCFASIQYKWVSVFHLFEEGGRFDEYLPVCWAD